MGSETENTDWPGIFIRGRMGCGVGRDFLRGGRLLWLFVLGRRDCGTMLCSQSELSVVELMVPLFIETEFQSLSSLYFVGEDSGIGSPTSEVVGIFAAANRFEQPATRPHLLPSL